MSMHTSERYSRQISLPGFGAAAQLKLSAAKVLVIGAGGLGVPALQYLTGMGVGSIGIMDGDQVSLSNLHRQVLYATADVGRRKAQLAVEKLNALNPEVILTAIPEMLTPQNALATIEAYDVVIDATDNFAARYLINDACVILNKPFVYGAVQQFEGHISVFNLNGGPTYRCLYPVPPSAGEISDCNAAGVLGVVPGIVGCMQALEAVKVITGIGKNLSGYLQVLDLLQGERYSIRLRAAPERKAIVALQESYELSCGAVAKLLQPHELRQWLAGQSGIRIVDVREAAEFEQGHLAGAHHMPLSAISRDTALAEPSVPLVLYCQRGGRSIKAASLLQEVNPLMSLYVLAGGLDGWRQSEA